MDGERGVMNKRAVGLATAKDNGEKRIMIGKDCGFFVVADSFYLWEMIGIQWCLGLEIKRGQRYLTPQFHDQPYPEH